MKTKQIHLPLYMIASILFGLKTFLVYLFVFDMSIDNPMQAILFFLNPFISAFAFFGLSIWLKGKYQKLFICIGAFIGTVIVWANTMFYRDFTDFITIPVMFQANNAGDVTNSISTLFHWTDPLLFIDVIALVFLSFKQGTTSYIRRKKLSILSLSAVMVLANLLLAEVARPQLYTNVYDREDIVKNIGLFNYHLYDIGLQSLTTSQKVFADGSKLNEIKDYVQENVKSKEKSDLFGIAENRNLIFVSLESVQSFVIGNKVNGEEITPFLNDLTKNSYYFENFYHQVAQGKTSDSEFLVGNSLYPLPGGAVFFVRGQNEYHAMPERLAEQGYTSAVFHANDKSFWNRNIMYDSMGYQKFFDETAYEITEENSVGWGLKDKSFFTQSMKYLEDLPQPFYSKFITLTNHHPYELGEEDTSIEAFDSESETVNQYFQTVRYTDEAIQQFFKQLKQSGLYENSVIVLMGDHYGISEYEYDALGQYLGKDIDAYDDIQLQRVPFFIHIPGEEGKVMSKISGQIDVKPTLLHLLGVDTTHDIGFGTDLFTKQRKDFIAFRDGSFVSDKYVYSEETCYERGTGRILAEDTNSSNPSVCKPVKDQVQQELDYSDDIVYGDLFRFYHLND
ncbi:LTA synthase family protein [Virgibacillus sp. MSP4-1]|uniref:LTA synthase family protein n=1 Tax=Virgibacillus sp. MSP4-1 TaxID=2700081 RepID=UPI00039D2B74|nr:LTA synthase family protein [Virgibacillus sp. MSP4-1]QHS23779.1 LTA synthase family protein [Virgibacillus sp. MSP4-1]